MPTEVPTAQDLNDIWARVLRLEAMVAPAPDACPRGPDTEHDFYRMGDKEFCDRCSARRESSE